MIIKTNPKITITYNQKGDVNISQTINSYGRTETSGIEIPINELDNFISALGEIKKERWW